MARPLRPSPHPLSLANVIFLSAIASYDVYENLLRPFFLLLSLSYVFFIYLSLCVDNSFLVALQCFGKFALVFFDNFMNLCCVWYRYRYRNGLINAVLWTYYSCFSENEMNLYCVEIGTLCKQQIQIQKRTLSSGLISAVLWTYYP